MGKYNSSATFDVVIVGAGPSGLALAIELGTRGITCLVVERNDRVGYAPRAKTTNVRTRSHLRRWGIAQRLAEVSPFGTHYPSNVHFVTRLAGSSLAVIENASNCAPTRHQDYPEHGQWVPQYKLERVLREHASTLPAVSFRFNTEFLSSYQQGATVHIQTHNREDNSDIAVTASYLVGADGARSAVREELGATLRGTYGMSRNYNIVFRAPGLAQAHSHGPGTMYWQVHPAAPSIVGPMDADDLWFFEPTRLPEGFTLTLESAPALIRRATGIEIPYQVLSSDEWIASSLLADRYFDRRVFLIGDACHLHPPFGGYGMNMGIADGVDLGWKIAATIEGWGGPLLLESYALERRGIHVSIIAEAAANHGALPNDFWHEDLERSGSEGDAARRRIGELIRAVKTREFHTLGTVLGGSYEGSPIVEGDKDAGFPTHAGREYVPSNRAGCLAPHVWRGETLSLYDEFGPGFTLICTPGAAQSEIQRVRREALNRAVPVKTVLLTSSEAAGRYTTPLTIVRPDQYVAWRGALWHSGLLAKLTGWSSVLQ